MSSWNPFVAIANRPRFAAAALHLESRDLRQRLRLLFWIFSNGAFVCCCVLFCRSGVEASFITAPTYPSGRYGGHIAVGDFNGDGIPDLAVVNADPVNTVSILLGKGDGTFEAPKSYAAGNVLRSVVIGDFDADGKLDIAVTNAGLDGMVTILLGNGDGTFQAGTSYPVGVYPGPLAVGDFNNDGVLDLAVARPDVNESGTVSVLLGNGDGTFQPAVDSSAPSPSPGALATGDFNGDGILDLAVTSSLNPGTVSVLLGKGDGTFGNPQSYRVGDQLSGVAVGDFNGDGLLDLVVVDFSNAVHILLGNGDGSFQAAQGYTAGYAGSYSVSVAVRDLNGDGKLDLAVTRASGVSILLGNGDGTFQAARTYAAGILPVAGAVGDFNGDGIPDLVVANFNGFSFPSTVSILLGTGNGTFQAAPTYPDGSASFPLAVADFNGDGIPDIAAVNSRRDGTVSILLGNGNGSFQPPRSYAVGSYPQSGTVGDFNGDGIPDLAIAGGFSSGTVSVLLGNGDGTFQAARTFAAGAPPPPPVIGTFSLAVGDFNGDGKLDIVTTNFYVVPYGGGIAASDVRVFLGNGNGTFQAAQSYVAGSQPNAVVVGDFNEDGILDLAVADSTYPRSAVNVLLGNGDGSFQAPRSYAADSLLGSLIVGDFNGDGHLDLAVGYPETDTVSVWLGKGDGSFQTVQNSAAVSMPGPMAVGDFNRDGMLDLLVSNGQLGTVSVLLGNGDGTFQLAGTFAAGDEPVGPPMVGDFNGDSYPDVAVGNTHGTVTILINAADWGR